MKGNSIWTTLLRVLLFLLLFFAGSALLGFLMWEALLAFLKGLKCS